MNKSRDSADLVMVRLEPNLQSSDYYHNLFFMSSEADAELCPKGRKVPTALVVYIKKMTTESKSTCYIISNFTSWGFSLTCTHTHPHEHTHASMHAQTHIHNAHAATENQVGFECVNRHHLTNIKQSLVRPTAKIFKTNKTQTAHIVKNQTHVAREAV